MNKLLMAALGAVLFVAVGCQNDHSSSTTTSAKMDTGSTSATMSRSDAMSGQDDCPHCPGVQTAKADGTCPQCGMKVKTASR
jgi:hypothetical protein